MNKLINVFLEPRETFTSLQEQNNWKNAFLPIVITAVVGFASMVVLGELLTEVQIEQTETFIMESSQIPDDQNIMICIAMGYPDEDFPANHVRSVRADNSDFVKYIGFEES